jgi:hypothetical protein
MGQDQHSLARIASTRLKSSLLRDQGEGLPKIILDISLSVLRIRQDLHGLSLLILCALDCSLDQASFERPNPQTD